MRIPTVFSVTVVSLALAGCPLDRNDEEKAAVASPCPAGQVHLRDSSARDLCVALETVAEPPFQPGFWTARVTHRVTVTDAQGRPVNVDEDPVIAAVGQYPAMKMDNGHEHSTPYAATPEASSQPAQGVYDLVAYYVMASMGGQWRYEVRLQDRGASAPLQAVFHPQVKMVSGDDVFVALASHPNDRWKDMSGLETKRPYRVWLHAVRPENGAHRLTVFVSTRDAQVMNMGGMSMRHVTFPAVVPGSTTLHDENDSAVSVDTVTLQASADGGQTWTTLNHLGQGRFEGLVSGLTSGQRATVQLAFSVNGLAMKTSADADPSLSFVAP